MTVAAVFGLTARPGDTPPLDPDQYQIRLFGSS